MNYSANKLLLFIKRRKAIPKWLYRFVLKYSNLLDIRKAIWMSGNPYKGMPSISSYHSKYGCTIGIVKEFCDKHLPYVAACMDLGVCYKVIDISGPDWLRKVRQSGCDAFMVPPSGLTSVWKQMYDERFRVIVQDLGKKIFPSYNSIWLYESKRRMHYWLEANGVPHPRTWIFYDLKQALEFVEETDLPIVYKSDFGSGASGVKIFRDRTALRRHVKRCFKRGYGAYTRCASDKEWASVLLQEYRQDVKEWRMIRLGDSYFGHQKLKKNDFHSGSDRFAWIEPPDKLLDFVLSITEKGNFKSMNLDIFETCDGCYLVNELQTFFGWIRPYHMMVNGKAGRYVYDYLTQKWLFNEGVYCQNGGCNLRLASFMSEFDIDVELTGISDLHLVSEEDKRKSVSRIPIDAGEYLL